MSTPLATHACTCYGLCGALPFRREAWNFLAPATCICLDGASERAERAMREFCAAGMCAVVRMYRPQRDPVRSARGCWESHRAILSEAAVQGTQHATVFEDDVTFTDDMRRLGAPEWIALLLGATKDRTNWSVLFLGHLPALLRPTLEPGLVRVVRAWCMHAYIASPAFCAFVRTTPHDTSQRIGTGKNTLSLAVGMKWPNCVESRGPPGIDCYPCVRGPCFAPFPMVAYQAGNSHEATRVTSNPKGRMSFLQPLISPTGAKVLEAGTTVLPAFVAALVAAALVATLDP
jgi:hypothetical protein